MQFRKKRLEKAITFHVNDWLRSYYDDPDIVSNVSLTGVIVADDLSYVKLYVHWNRSSLEKDLLPILEQQSFKVRKLLAVALSFKRAPVVKFYYDEERDEFNDLCQIMAEIN